MALKPVMKWDPAESRYRPLLIEDDEGGKHPAIVDDADDCLPKCCGDGGTVTICADVFDLEITGTYVSGSTDGTNCVSRYRFEFEHPPELPNEISRQVIWGMPWYRECANVYEGESQPLCSAQTHDFHVYTTAGDGSSIEISSSNFNGTFLGGGEPWCVPTPFGAAVIITTSETIEVDDGFGGTYTENKIYIYRGNYCWYQTCEPDLVRLEMLGGDEETEPCDCSAHTERASDSLPDVVELDLTWVSGPGADEECDDLGGTFLLPVVAQSDCSKTYQVSRDPCEVAARLFCELTVCGEGVLCTWSAGYSQESNTTDDDCQDANIHGSHIGRNVWQAGCTGSDSLTQGPPVGWPRADTAGDIYLCRDGYASAGSVAW